MKRIISLVGLLCCGLWSAVAQMPVTTLQHSGKARLFYGNNSFSEACDASVNGDTLYLSPGGFTPPASISKGIVVIGSGYAPDSVTVKKRTAINGNLNIAAGASHLLVEGLYLANDIVFSDQGGNIDSVTIIRSRFGTLSYRSGSDRRRISCHVEECYFEIVDDIDSLFVARNNLINGRIMGGYCNVIENNIFLGSYFWDIECDKAYISNNIFLRRSSNVSNVDASENFINNYYNNLFNPSISLSSNAYSTNTYKAADSTIFVKYSSNADFFAQDFHLKDPSKYIGTDGTQIGIYGGVHAAKEV